MTVALSPRQSVESLRAWAEARGLKCTHIVLARGASTSQPMLTRDGRGTLMGQHAAASAVMRELAGDGFAISRLKIEAAPWNGGAPRTDAEGAAQPPHRYFEHHLKLLLRGDIDDAAMTGLTDLARRHAAHLSRNALRVRADGRQERFVTQRCYRVGQETARARLAVLRDALAAKYEILDVEEEFVVYDSNLALDAGWLDDNGGRDAAEGEVS